MTHEQDMNAAPGLLTILKDLSLTSHVSTLILNIKLTPMFCRSFQFSNINMNSISI